MPMSSLAVWRRRRFPSLFAAMAMVAVVAACDSSTGTDNDVAAVAVNPPTPILNIGQTQQLVATATTSGGRIVNASPTWTTSAASVATVDGNGLVTAVGGGTATITATAGGESADATITVWFPTQTVALAPAAGQSATILQEGTTQLAATITDTQGGLLPQRQLIWTSDDTDVARVSSSGLVSARGIDGTVTITAATLDGVQGTFDVTVSGPPAVATVTLAHGLGRFLAPTMTDQWVGTARAQSGTVLSLTGRTVVWTSSQAGIATVTDGVAGGLVTGVASGSSNIRVSVDGVQSANVSARVEPAAPVGATAQPTIGLGNSIYYVIDVPAGTESLAITLTGDVPGADADIYLYNPAGTLIAQSFNANTAESITRNAPAAGRYLLEINAWDGADAASDGAILTVTITAAP